MNDNALFSLLRSTILAGFTARGMAGWKVARSFQPKQQGANTVSTVYLFKIGPDRRHGSPQEKFVWNVGANRMDETFVQQYESTFQASVMMDESTDPAALTPSDVANIVCDIIQTDEGLEALRAQGVGILRVGEVRNPYDENDRGQFQANPSFDFVLTFRRTRTSTAKHATSIEGNIYRV